MSRGRALYLAGGKGSGQEVDTFRLTLFHAPPAFITTDSGQQPTESAKPPELAAPGLQAEKLAEKIKWCVEHQDNLKEIGACARTIYEEHFTTEVFENTLLGYVRECMKIKA